MPPERSTPDYLPWLLAHDFGLQPCPDTFAEIWDLGSDQYVIGISNETHKTNCLVKFNREWAN